MNLALAPHILAAVESSLPESGSGSGDANRSNKDEPLNVNDVVTLLANVAIGVTSCRPQSLVLS